ncbi:MAG: biopolymer transporter ExbD [Myxococcota bacterium]|nr:biopolymer transporter ExbD [Myxococcota bacterium]
MPQEEEEMEEPNLIPVMNLVMLLIPVLLMTTAFFEVAVINVAAPKVQSGPAPDEPPKDDKPKLNLTVVIGNDGFKVCAYGGCLGPGGAPPEPGAAAGPSAGGAPTIPTKKYLHSCQDAAGRGEGPPPGEGQCALINQVAICKQGLAFRKHNLPYPERLQRFGATTVKNGVNALNGGMREDCDGDGKADFDMCDAAKTDCKYLNYDYAALREQLYKLKVNAEQERKVMIMASEVIPFEAVVGVMDAARETATDTDEKKKELFPDVVLSPGFQ